MSQPVPINARIVEALYNEALILSDDVRAAFDMSLRPYGEFGLQGEDEDLARVAFSCEALRTTTRMMHALAWLLNHRAYFMGELSEFQLQRHGGLATEHPGADPKRVELLDPDTRDLIVTTERFYARLVRLDTGWRQRDPSTPSAITRLRDRLNRAVAN
jgi:regulator of CtrA degradation